jgi:hypothetical protein
LYVYSGSVRSRPMGRPPRVSEKERFFKLS